jgi:predicted heme/steroid binding protein
MATAAASNVLRLPGEGLATGLEQLEWAEVQKHNTRASSWLVINDQVYDITNFGRRHPGRKVIYHYAGQDATDSFRALHPDSALVMKYLKPLLIGQVAPGSSTAASTVDGARPAPSAFVEEFRQMRKEFEEQGLFEASWTFFFGMLAHIFLLEAAAYYSIKVLGNSWPVYLLAVALLATALCHQSHIGDFVVAHGRLVVGGGGVAAGFSAATAVVFALRSLLGAGRLLRPWWRGPRSFGGVPRTGGGGGGSGGSIRRTCRSCCRGSGGGTTGNAGPSTKPNRNTRCTSNVPTMAKMRRPRSRGRGRVRW